MGLIIYYFVYEDETNNNNNNKYHLPSEMLLTFKAWLFLRSHFISQKGDISYFPLQ